MPAFDFFGTSLLCRGREFRARPYRLITVPYLQNPNKLVSYGGYNFVISGSLASDDCCKPYHRNGPGECLSVKKNQTLRVELVLVLGIPDPFQNPDARRPHGLPTRGGTTTLFLCCRLPAGVPKCSQGYGMLC